MKRYKIVLPDYHALARISGMIDVQLPGLVTLEETGDRLTLIASANERFNLNAVLEKIKDHGIISTIEEVI